MCGLSCKNFLFIFRLLPMLNQLTSAIIVLERNNGNTEEYCELETFRPQCMKNEVVIIESAIYGRRYVSRCLEKENFDFDLHPSFLGCSANVMDYLGSKCSGKRMCDIRIPDANLQQAKPCPIGLDMFLEVSYSCIEVVEEDRSCVVSVTSSYLHLSKPILRPSSAHQTGATLHCGTKSQPWLLEAPAGQRINISLLDFTPAAVALSSPDSSKSAGMNQEANRMPRPHNCTRQQHQYGYLIDKSVPAAGRKNVSICGATGSRRVTDVYLTASNSLELVLASEFQQDSTSNFLLRVEAVGCSDLIPPEDAWLKRTDNEAIVGCYTSRQTWHLKCEDRRWIGVVSNCTSFETARSVDGLKAAPILLAAANEMSDLQALIIIAVSFIGLAVCLIIICCGIYCLRRYSTLVKMNDTMSHQPQYKYVKQGISQGTNQETHQAIYSYNGSV